MNSKSDDGAIYGQTILPIAWDETALSLTLRSATASRELVRAVVPGLIAHSISGVCQHSLGKPTYFCGRNPKDGVLNLNGSAEDAFNLIRAVADPWPNAFLETSKGIVKVSWGVYLQYPAAPRDTFRETEEGVIVGFNNSATRVHTLRKANISSERPTEHAAWLREIGLPQARY